MLSELALVGTTALVLGVLLPFAIRPLLARIGSVDVPNDRSSHSAPTLRGGGLAPLLAWDAALVVSLLLGMPDVAPVLILLAATNLAAAVGFVDDVVSLGSGVRLLLQLAIGVGSGLAVTALFGLSPWWSVLMMIAIAGYINVANFIDGINGISGVHGAIAGLAFVVAGSTAGQMWLAVAGIALAAAFVAFLPWNLRRPSLFLGDVGSYLLGAVIGVVVVMALAASVSPLLVVPVLAPWLADTMTTIVRRFARAEGVLSAHRTHAYQRLTDTGLSHGVVTVIAGSVSASSAVLGYLSWTQAVPTWLGLAGVAALSVAYVALPRIRGSRLPMPVNRPFVSSVPAAAAAANPRQRRRWAVVGASGFVGSGVAAHLRSRGYEVQELRAPRLRCDAHQLSGESIVRQASVDPVAAAMASQLAGVDVVINAAGAAAPDADATQDLWGANAYLPTVLAEASRRAGAARFVHLSSAAVQGRAKVLDESTRYAPFSPYSRSKALGEVGLLMLADSDRAARPGIIIVRATSVQGPGRPTTQRLRRLAASRLASVASPGSQQSVVSGLHGLAATIEAVGREPGAVPGIVLQPWEGLSVSDVLRTAGSRRPLVLPRWLCTIALSAGYFAGRVAPAFAGLARRLEMMWFGQTQEVGWASPRVARDERWLQQVLASGEVRDDG
ncbi:MULTISPECIES: NAD-dependent epimerase/dehydratase family protein [unclassified Microbacterium]|uniref:NAD-dependent epimerase/dehydratase family protein n=1 Tax=unclassified Microbacterium TaxID=2609290 RepID=UPI0021A28AC9|nr:MULTISPECIES: NAD-dependent epimerase/dehydratase family protein [unclassified Microbacterium]MCT1364393.1 NAD-dependent epimerase/dehydratase family protein [Microbacterium sp. p3-SID131]MCT1377885.1 NAD-dependent epimerase/dehydratase family protein [Microbacterium sp. p3-SID337]